MNIAEQRKYLQKNIERLTAPQIALVSKYVAYLQSASAPQNVSQRHTANDPLTMLVDTIKQTSLRHENIIPPAKSIQDISLRAEGIEQSTAEQIAPVVWNTAWDQLEQHLKEEARQQKAT